MKKSLWFKAKNYGWGWYPCSWQGWIILLLYTIGLIWNFYRLDEFSNSNSDTIRPFAIQTLLMTIFLVIVCYKTGEKPEWRWGRKKFK